MTPLHILNGTAMLDSFEQSGLEGDIMVWHEVLSEGPLLQQIDSAEFWRRREHWLCKTFGEAPESYREKAILPLEKLNEPYSEITLWFEFDLHCQVNLLGVMNYLAQKTDLSLPKVYLVCPADFPGKDNFRGMGELDGGELAFLFDNIREELSEADFATAAGAWAAYVKQDAPALQAFIDNTAFWGCLHCLKPALAAQINRLRTNAGGLNGVEQALLDIYRSGVRSKKGLYRAFGDKQKTYGMGDSEIDIYLRRLSDKGLIQL